ncbi:hypothetical protein BD289DRAFT_110247 [Coniella lustricola]|uniref:Uncharacterized protein n=1 Tax=Coniella lustricola TaxID=2025994 RepID=A0A2T2ZXE1_9PEZI|nr:hypothetical protein BD289DRAFT_110247 [Coniella lustricola]
MRWDARAVPGSKRWPFLYLWSGKWGDLGVSGIWGAPSASLYSLKTHVPPLPFPSLPSSKYVTGRRPVTAEIGNASRGTLKTRDTPVFEGGGSGAPQAELYRDLMVADASMQPAQGTPLNPRNREGTTTRCCANFFFHQDKCHRRKDKIVTTKTRKKNTQKKARVRTTSRAALVGDTQTKTQQAQTKPPHAPQNPLVRSKKKTKETARLSLSRDGDQTRP